MTKIHVLTEAVKRLSSQYGPTMFFDAQVVAVDEEQYLCDVLLEHELEVYNIRLRAIVSDNHSIDILPKIGSSVVLGKIDDSDYIVIAHDEITSYRITTGSTVLKLSADGILIQKGKENLKAIFSDFVDQVLKVYAPKDVAGLMDIKLRLNDLLE